MLILIFGWLFESVIEIVESDRTEQIKPKDSKSTQPVRQLADWEREAQIKKNQKAMEHFQQKLENRSPMTEEEIKQSQEDFRVLQEIIENSRSINSTNSSTSESSMQC